MIKTDFLVVGSGFFGSVLAERISNILNKEVIIIEKRDHVGGNCYSKIDEKTGIEYHKYGTHIFHTSNENVWSYLSNFCVFNSYRHQVLTKYKKQIYQLPINLETINSFFNKNYSPLEAENHLKKITKKFKRVSYENFEEKALSQIGDKLYDAFIKNYTEKQWGKKPKYLPSTIFNRLPLRFNYREDYFNNCKYQGIPDHGYTNLFNQLLQNKKIKLHLNKNFNLNENKILPKYMTIYTGALDSLLNFKFGRLEWRSLKFIKKVINLKDFQGTSVVNYPEKKIKFTRVHEPKHLHIDRTYPANKTLIIEEYPVIDNEEPYYPINDQKNRRIHRKYKTEISKIKNFEFGGRLADYAYYDMDMTISAALNKFNLIKKKIK